MSSFRNKDISDRLSAAENARKAMLQRFKEKPGADDPADDLPELLGGLSGLEADIKVDRGLEVAMTQDPANIFVVAGLGPEDQSCCRVPELMHGDAQAGCLLDALGGLAAQCGQAFVTSAHAGKQPRLVEAAQQNVQMIVE